MTPTISLSPGISSWLPCQRWPGQRGTLPTASPRFTGPAELAGPAGEVTRPAGEPVTPAGELLARQRGLLARQRENLPGNAQRARSTRIAWTAVLRPTARGPQSPTARTTEPDCPDHRARLPADHREDPGTPCTCRCRCPPGRWR